MQDKTITAAAVQVSPATPLRKAAVDTTGRDTAWEIMSMNLDASPRSPIKWGRPRGVAEDTGGAAAGSTTADQRRESVGGAGELR